MAGKSKILIAGAGIGGLTAAGLLLQAGHDVEVFEQAPDLGEVGAGIQISANAARVLRHLGVLDPLEKFRFIRCAPNSACMTRPRSWLKSPWVKSIAASSARLTCMSIGPICCACWRRGCVNCHPGRST